MATHLHTSDITAPLYIMSKFHQANFLTSAPDLARCPTDSGSEIAFAGRSNAGKSSAINALCNNKQLARTSKTPGRTQLINFFQLGAITTQRLVDLPGYGYAKVAEAVKRQWQKNLSAYLQKRDSLKGLVVVMDIRHPMREVDSDLINWAVESELAVHILLTKVDKLKSGQANTVKLKLEKHLADAKVDDLVSVQCFSSLKKQGLDQLSEQLLHWLEEEGSEQGNH